MSPWGLPRRSYPSEPFPHFVDDYLGYLYEVHPGPASLDGVHLHDDTGCGVANALAGRALDAASYAAYASVYAYGGYAVAAVIAVAGPVIIVFASRWRADALILTDDPDSVRIGTKVRRPAPGRF